MADLNSPDKRPSTNLMEALRAFQEMRRCSAWNSLEMMQAGNAVSVAYEESIQSPSASACQDIPEGLTKLSMAASALAASEALSADTPPTSACNEMQEAIGYLTRNVLEPNKAIPLDTLMGICTQVDHLCATGRGAYEAMCAWRKEALDLRLQASRSASERADFSLNERAANAIESLLCILTKAQLADEERLIAAKTIVELRGVERK